MNPLRQLTPAKKPLTVTAPLVPCSELPMFNGHHLALTGWLEADRAELTLVAPPRGRGGFKGHRLPVLRIAPKLETHGYLCVRAGLKRLGAFLVSTPRSALA
jgi:hypothetical protein